MAEIIGQIIKKVAVSKGLSQKEFGILINKTKQGVASIYRRSTIEIELLMLISKVLDHDFFAELYNRAYMVKFKEQITKQTSAELKKVNDELITLQKLLESKEDLLRLQNKYIIELENKLNI